MRAKPTNMTLVKFLIFIQVAMLALVIWMAVQSAPCAFGAPCPVGSSIIFDQDLGIQGGTAFTTTLTSAPTAARTITIPDATDTLAVLGLAQTYTGENTWTAPLNFDAEVRIKSANKLYYDGGGNTYIHQESADRMELFIGGTKQYIWSDGTLNFDRAMIVTLKGGYLEMNERTAPGAGSANSVRIYAVVDGGSRTDLAAVFQDGTVDIFAQETTEPDDPIITSDSRTRVKWEVRKPHPGLVELGIVFPDDRFQAIRTWQYHDTDKIGWVKGAEGPLPADWFKETKPEREQRHCEEKGGTWLSPTCTLPRVEE